MDSLMDLHSNKIDRTITEHSENQNESPPSSYLAPEYQRWQDLSSLQPPITQRFFEMQARSLVDALLQPASQAHFCLPDQIIASPGDLEGKPVPAEQREQMVGGFMDRLTRSGIVAVFRQRLDELEASDTPTVAVSAGLLRYTTARVLVHDMLPSGRSVRYLAAEGEEVPSLPVEYEQAAGSAIMAETDAIGEDGHDRQDDGRGELLVPYVPAARRFFLPQWVAFDDQDRLLARSAADAEAHLISMQRYVHILHTAISLASYTVVDIDYQQKRYGMLGQLINQGRALARFQTREIITTIKRRASANDLNRGLSLNLPYFDDQSLEMKRRDFDIIPAGRIMFIPAFVVLATRKELAKVEQDTRLDRSTRKHLLDELRMLEEAFLSAGQK
jgi:hypothetical protein